MPPGSQRYRVEWGRRRERQERREQKDGREENDRWSEREVESRSETGAWDAMGQIRMEYLWPILRETTQGVEEQSSAEYTEIPIPDVSDEPDV